MITESLSLLLNSKIILGWFIYSFGTRLLQVVIIPCSDVEMPVAIDLMSSLYELQCTTVIDPCTAMKSYNNPWPYISEPDNNVLYQ